MADYSSMSVAELRKLVREKHPHLRGNFASSAQKEELVHVLDGSTTPAQALADFLNRIGGTAHAAAAASVSGVVVDGVPADQELAEGTGGENPPVDKEAHVPVDSLNGGLEKVMEAVKVLYPAAAATLQGLIEDAKQRAEMSNPIESMMVTGGRITIAGVEVPMVLGPQGNDPVESMSCPHHPDAIMQRVGQDTAKCAACGRIQTEVGPEPDIVAGSGHVPQLDPRYRFDFWRAEHVCGAVVFEQVAGDFIKCLLADDRIMLVGPPASGKTSIVEQVASRCNWPVTRFNGNRDVTVQDFVGTYEARDGSTHWVDGPLVQAMREGHILLLDEVDHMPAECSSVLHSVCEPGGKLVITAHGGEVVKPHANFRVVGTANTAGFGDESGLHPNAQVQDAAFLSRFGVVFRVGWPAAKHEKNLLVASTDGSLDKDIAKLIVKVAADTRNAAKSNDILYPITLRQTLAWAGHVKQFDVGTAFALAVLNKMPEQDVAAMAEIAQRHFGDKLGGGLATDKKG